MKPKSYQFTGGEIIHLKPDILVVKYRMDRNIADHDMMDQRNVRKEILSDIPHYPIIDMTNGVVTFNEEAKAWAAVNEESAKARRYDILLVKGAAMKLKAKFYTMMYKPKNTTKIFVSMDEVLEFIEKDRLKNRESAKLK